MQQESYSCGVATAAGAQKMLSRRCSPSGRAWSEGGAHTASALSQHEDALLHAVPHEKAQHAQRAGGGAQAAQCVGAAQGLDVRLRVPVRVQDDD